MNTPRTKRFFDVLNNNGWAYSEEGYQGFWWPPVTLRGKVRAREAARAREMQRRGLLGAPTYREEGICYPELP